MCISTGWTPDQVRALSGEDYANFAALYSDDPWGPERDNAHTAMLLAQQANIYKRKGAPPVNPNKYMLGRSGAKSNKAKVAAFRAHVKNQIHQQKLKAQDGK